MRIRYTVTTITQSCPHCHKVIKRRTESDLQNYLFIFILPIVIPYILIRGFAFQNPEIPKIGKTMIQCRHCSLPVRTGKRAVEDLNTEERFIHDFKPWFYMCYVMGGIWGISCCSLPFCDKSSFAICIFLFIVSLIWIITTAIVYRVSKKRNLEEAKRHAAPFLCCSRCRAQLSPDSLFCSVCGLKIK